MLSRFSKLPGLSSFLASTTYPQEAVDQAISEIKSVGKSVHASNSNDESLHDISKILTLMKRFSESMHVQRVACHALSNLAMQVVAARWIIQKGGFALIKKSIAKFHSDHKLCWLASSATWNLARPPANHGLIGRDGVRLMLQILFEHRDREKVANTAVGALSNLSLQEELKDVIAEEGHLDLLVAVMSQHLGVASIPVLTSGAGLLANLAVSDEHASVIVQKGALKILMKLLAWRAQEDETLYRNTCAALNNLVTAEGFLPAFLRAEGIECVYGFLAGNSNELYVNLLENCLINIDADSNVRTTSLHLAAFHGQLGVLRELYAKNVHGIDLDACDGHKRTLLDYAIAENHGDVVDFLCRCGARNHSRSSNDLSDEMAAAIESGYQTLNSVRKDNEKAVIVALPHFPTDLCKYMAGFQHHVDMLEAVEKF
jgi:ankyrin repeat protein